jgi:hypothetical protein
MIPVFRFPTPLLQIVKKIDIPANPECFSEPFLLFTFPVIQKCWFSRISLHHWHKDCLQKDALSSCQDFGGSWIANMGYFRLPVNAFQAERLMSEDHGTTRQETQMK